MIIENYQDFISENDFDFKQIFLKLTEYTVPFGYEETLEPILYAIVPNLQKDEYGNYYISIGKSRTLFTSHLDTYCKRREKINHVVKGKIIKTDGSTVLGGDNKNGVVILLYMIKNNVPGTYYFFKGEEGIVTGTSCNGSTWLLKNDPNIFGKYDRAIAFDRRGKGSIVTKQRARHCCSNEFADALVDAFGEQNLKFKKDYAYGTDSAVFMDIVPEITNISSGGEYEHSFMESTDIKYTKKVAVAATKINWDDLPVVRNAFPVETLPSTNVFTDDTINKSKRTYNKLCTVLGVKGFNSLNDNNFKPGTVMLFDQYVKDNQISLTVVDDIIKIINDDNYLEGFKQGTIEELIEHLKLKDVDFAQRVIGAITRKMNDKYEVSRGDLNVILDDYMISYDTFKDYINNSDYKDYFKFDEDIIFMDIIANQSTTIKRQKEQKEKTT